jgi:Ca2+-binding EF-hand superfamily protein
MPEVPEPVDQPNQEYFDGADPNGEQNGEEQNQEAGGDLKFSDEEI